MHYVLIIFAIYHGYNAYPTSVEFNSLDACKLAKEKVESESTTSNLSWYEIKAICAEKGQ